MADNSRNPFYTGSDRPSGSFQSYGGGGGGGGQQSTQQQVQASQSRQLETQKRALQSIYHSEQMGVSTGEELVRQGEVLNRTEEKLDHIEAVQKDSQKHINSLGSVFGGFKNWFRGDSAKKRPEPPAGQSRYEAPGQSLKGAVAASSTSQARRPEPGLGGDQQQQQQQAPASGYDRAFNENLGEMSDGVSRLKQLAMGLGGEIERQNDQLERMHDKTERTNVVMDRQNQDMNRILYGSKAGKK